MIIQRLYELVTDWTKGKVLYSNNYGRNLTQQAEENGINYLQNNELSDKDLDTLLGRLITEGPAIRITGLMTMMGVEKLDFSKLEDTILRTYNELLNHWCIRKPLYQPDSDCSERELARLYTLTKIKPITKNVKKENVEVTKKRLERIISEYKIKKKKWKRNTISGVKRKDLKKLIKSL